MQVIPLAAIEARTTNSGRRQNTAQVAT